MKPELPADSYSLSPMQQGMLFHWLSAREPGVDVEQILCELHEPIEPEILERAWQRTVSRHNVLRTSFHWEDLEAQQVHSCVPISLPQQDWRDISPPERDSLRENFLQVDRLRGFDLTKAPLMRLALFRTDETCFQLVWTFHHLLLDGRGVALVLNEVFSFYEAFSRGEDLQLPPARSYRKHIEWLQKQDWSNAEVFWRQTLKGFTAPTPLIVARAPGPEAERPDNRGEQEIRLSTGATSALKSIAVNNDLTLNTVVQGGWALLLSRYSGEEDVVFGAIRACRRSTVEGADSMVGLFINTVPMRVRIDPDARLLPWLAELRQRWLAIRPFEHTPLVKIHGWSEVPRGAPLFESIFNFQDRSWDAVLRAQDGKWATREFDIRSQSNYPLAMDAYGGSELLLKILYHRNRFDDAAITRMLGHLKTLLEGMAVDPAQRLSQLPLLTDPERHQLLVEWNDTAAEFPKQKCVHQLVEEQAEATPDALAVADETSALTYRELNERASYLARHLQTMGVGPDVRVGVCMKRSAEMIASLLAVWKAGGAYVPLDPSYPRERLEFILKDAQVPVLLTQETLGFAQSSDYKVLCVSGLLDPTRHTLPEIIPNSELQIPNSADLAYVIYTSGSTGTPKGVEIEHASLVNLITWHQRTYQVTPADRATQLASPAFDATVWELWPYLTAGASIHIPDEETRLSSAKLTAWLAARRITLTFVPTPLTEAMFDEPWPERCTLRALLTGGDKLHRRPPAKFPCAVLNHYGPTENTVVTTWTEVSDTTCASGAPPIGRPISNTQVYILDRTLQPVPIGIPGELHIGGVSLARGYLNRPELTAEKFIPNPFGNNPAARLYKTGDLVRWLPDGNIEFLSRLDHQIKIRGNRIELGEIEAVLNQHPTVRESVVIARTDGGREQRLVAYVVPEPGQSAPSKGLRDFLKKRLPDYMLPVAFVILERLPLTLNGKMDRNALPAPTLVAETESVAPRTAIEEKLAGIWCEVLGLNQAGVHDNFFELGGHSLLATQVISRVQRAFQIELPLHELFDAPTIAGLAEKIGRTRPAKGRAGYSQHAARNALETSGPANAAEDGHAPILRTARNGQLPLSFAQERLWFLEQLEPGIPFNNIPIATQIEGDLNPAALQQALDEIVRRHETFRTIFENHNGRAVAISERARPLVMPMFKLSAQSQPECDAEVQRLLADEARRSFDLTQGPLLRAKLLCLTSNEHLLLLMTHHIACDGWSMGVFYRELAALYEAFARGRPSPLADLPIDYADFAHWQRRWLQGQVLEKQLTYWKQQLDGAPAALDLPTDRPRPPVQSYRGATRCFALPAKLSKDLAQLSRQEGITLFMLLVAAWQTLLHRCSGQEDILVGSPVAGRTRVETERLIGFFLNTLVLRGNLSGAPTFRELLKRTRQVALEAYAHQDVPFEKLVDALQLQRDLSRSALFQVMFVLQNAPLAPPELAGLKVKPLHVHSGTAKFDLMLSLEENAGGLSGFIEYSTDLFDETTIARMISHYETLLESIVANPDQLISEIPLLPESEWKQLLLEWNDTHAEFAADKCIHELFEEQVKRTPEAIALVFADEQLTYHELNERADHLAGELRKVGVGPEVCVGLCVERSLEMMVGLLGILKAGGAYVPLDPAYPKERLAFMLEDSQAPVCLTQEKLRSRFNFQIPNLKLFSVDALLDATRNTQHEIIPDSELQTPISANIAYVIYTSGSTGNPKGVMVTHRNVANFFAGMDRVLGTNPGEWLAVTSISFDISVLELFWTLARGFKVVIQPEDDRLPTATPRVNGETKNGQWRSLPELIVRHGVTHMQCTPSLAGTLVLVPESLEAMRRLSKLLLGGEALPVPLAEQLRATFHGELFNMYGPTETTVWSAAHHVERVAQSVPIGRPIANTQIYILDGNRQPVPVGVPGEIFIGGEGVARGYLHRPELTAEKFIRHPFNPGTDARLYRTGDLGRWLADGTIEFLGRIDNQVKIRGHRVELGEIESALGRHPAVREAVVVAREDVPGDQRIVAYVVTSPGARPSTAELRRFAREKLPEAMVPSAIVFLDALPLTPNGKVNRKAMPAPEAERPELETTYVAPRTVLEKSITKIWQELLRIEKVGLHDNFFDLGGHSLLVVQMQARLRDVLGRDLPVVKLFQHPTVSALAGFLSEREQPALGNLRNRGRRKQAASGHRAKSERAVIA